MIAKLVEHSDLAQVTRNWLVFLSSSLPYKPDTISLYTLQLLRSNLIQAAAPPEQFPSKATLNFPSSQLHPSMIQSLNNLITVWRFSSISKSNRVNGPTFILSSNWGQYSILLPPTFKVTFSENLFLSPIKFSSSSRQRLIHNFKFGVHSSTFTPSSS